MAFPKVKECRKHDIYGYNPTYEWTSYKTRVGVVLSYISIAFIVFYIAITTRDYAVRPPELTSQGDIDLLAVPREIPFAIPRLGLRLGYTNTTDPTERVAALENDNPFVRFQFRHVVMKDQLRVHESELPFEDCIVSNIHSLCPIVNDTHMLQGTLYKQDYQFLEILVNKCTGEESCAALTEINDKLLSGEFRIRAQVSLESEQFDVERFHVTNSGMAISNRSFEYFGLPGVELQSDIFFQARRISKEQRYAGSPPMPETEINVLSLDQRETIFRPRSTNETNLMSFVVRLSDSVKLEEVSYWCPSILDLFGLWGAMASFVTALSLGFIAMQYNKWQFHKHFRHMAVQKKREAQAETLATMEWLQNKNNTKTTPNRDDMYSNLQAQYDALMLEPDIRLFESHHFDPEGRMAMSAAELKFPSTAFGELRRLAIMEHAKKKRAAQFISMWYGRHLLRKGFIRDEKRRGELFSPPDDLLYSKGGIKLFPQPSSRSFHLLRRRRKSTSPGKSLGEVERNGGDDIINDMEKGMGSDYKTTGSSEALRVDVSSGVSGCYDAGADRAGSEDKEKASGAEDDVKKSSSEAKRRASNAIAEMDLGTLTG